VNCTICTNEEDDCVIINYREGFFLGGQCRLEWQISKKNHPQDGGLSEQKISVSKRVGLCPDLVFRRGTL
jgi:hypothetical protein